MKKVNNDSLEEIVRRRVNLLTERVQASGGEILPEEIEELNRLERLAEVRKNFAPTPRRKRWPVVTVFAATLTIVSLLAFGRTYETEIELDLSTEEITFLLPSDQVLFQSIPLEGIGMSEVETVELPLIDEEAKAVSDSAVQVTAATAGNQKGMVLLSAYLAPAGTRVRLSHAGVPYHYRLSLSNNSTNLQIDLNGPVRINVAGRKPLETSLPVPRPMHVVPGTNGMELDLTLPESTRSRLAPQLDVAGLEFFRIDELIDEAGTAVRRRSSVVLGDLYYESLNGRVLQLRSGEPLRFDKSQGKIRSLELHKAHLELKFHGWVRGMATGSAENKRPLMPTWLEWLKERKSLYLFWGAAVYLFGLIIGALRWLRIEL